MQLLLVFVHLCAVELSLVACLRQLRVEHFLPLDKLVLQLGLVFFLRDDFGLVVFAGALQLLVLHFKLIDAVEVLLQLICQLFARFCVRALAALLLLIEFLNHLKVDVNVISGRWKKANFKRKQRAALATAVDSH